jgi:hypothetical protein
MDSSNFMTIIPACHLSSRVKLTDASVHTVLLIWSICGSSSLESVKGVRKSFSCSLNPYHHHHAYYSNHSPA